MTAEDFLSRLRCPSCGSSFDTGKGWEGLQYAVLSCRCSRYPVVAGIPILQRLPEVVSLVAEGHHRTALLDVLLARPPAPALLAPAWAKALPTFKGMGNLRSFLGRAGVLRWRDKGKRLFNRSADEVTVEDLVSFHFRHARNDQRNYFLFRLGQPRHLVACSMATVASTNGVVLDLACGMGHVTRQLLKRCRGETVVGLDQSFFNLYVAKNWLAEKAHYVCAAADISLPFPDKSLSMVFCSDAFQIFYEQLNCIRELKRVTWEDGVFVLGSVRNTLVK
jgi:hypothetical protein